MRRDTGRDNSKLTPQPLREKQPGWNEYIAIRDAQKVAKTHETIALQKRHGDDRTALAAKQKAERDELFKGNWKGKGEARNVLKSVIATQQAAEKLEQRERHAAERKALQAQYKPLPMYKQWKEQPQIVGMNVRPLIDQHIERDKQRTVAQTLRALSHSVDARKHITYQLGRRNVFRDEGRTIAVLDTKSDRGIAAALAVAQQKFGQTLELTGSDEFKRKAVAVAVENGLTCRFTDPALDKLREHLQHEKYRAERERMNRARMAAEKAQEAEKKAPAPQPLQTIQQPREAVPLSPAAQAPEAQPPVSAPAVQPREPVPAATPQAQQQRMDESMSAMLHWIAAEGGKVDPVEPSQRVAAHEGPVLHADALHCIQRTGKQQYTIHLLADLDALPMLGKPTTSIRYQQDGKAKVSSKTSHGVER